MAYTPLSTCSYFYIKVAFFCIDHFLDPLLFFFYLYLPIPPN